MSDIETLDDMFDKFDIDQQIDVSDESSDESNAIRLIEGLALPLAKQIIQSAVNLYKLELDKANQRNMNRNEEIKFSRNIDDRCRDLNDEISTMIKANALFSVFKKKNTKYNAFEDHFQLRILKYIRDNRQAKHQEVIETLKRNIRIYEREKLDLEMTDTDDILPIQIYDVIIELYELKINGNAIKESQNNLCEKPMASPKKPIRDELPSSPLRPPRRKQSTEPPRNVSPMNSPNFNTRGPKPSERKRFEQESMPDQQYDKFRHNRAKPETMRRSNEQHYYPDRSGEQMYDRNKYDDDDSLYNYDNRRNKMSQHNERSYDDSDDEESDTYAKGNSKNPIKPRRSDDYLDQDEYPKRTNYVRETAEIFSGPFKAYEYGKKVQHDIKVHRQRKDKYERSNRDEDNQGELSQMEQKGNSDQSKDISKRFIKEISSKQDFKFADILNVAQKYQKEYEKGSKENNTAEDNILKLISNLKEEIAKNATENKALNKNETINILLLGETGVGKSTFINAFANYLTYETLFEAKDAQPVSLIASSFTISDADYKQIEIKFGEDPNENNVAGNSATQGCRAYVFPYGDGRIRLIDTPGVGDTRGIGQDRINFENILDFISQYQDLHCICILLKPNNARITVTFEFCIKQLLTHLQKDASKNLVFLFTNARSTFYKPGDTAPALISILKTIEKTPPNVKITFEKNNIYCLDNEAFRFLVALKNGIEFNDEAMNNFSESWRMSAKECMRLMQYIIGTNDGKPGLKAHKVKETISVNEARQLIVSLSQPLADIAQNIDHNLKVLERHKMEIRAVEDNIELLKGKLFVPQLDLEIIQLNHPKTVCAYGKCCEVYSVAGMNKYNYTTVCHAHCYLGGSVQKEVLGDPGLLNCAAMSSCMCTICKHGCDYKIHLHVYYDTRVLENNITDKDVESMIQTNEGVKAQAEKTISDIETRSKDMKDEMDVITKKTAKFAYFLKINAITPYNDAFKSYLEHLIKNEESLSNDDPKNAQALDGLKQMLKNYEQEKLILDKAIKDDQGGGECEPLSNIFNEIDELYNLKIYGQKIRESQQKQKSPRSHKYDKQEVVHSAGYVNGIGQHSMRHTISSFIKTLFNFDI